uniref:RING-type domain-containing protein n=1 Tax=Prymnesium polylepis TaxID=72548 RepID=A0A7S4MS11_9EUKA
MPLFFPRSSNTASPGPRSRHDVIRGRLCFGSKPESPVVRQLRGAVTEREIWSPTAQTARLPPVENNVPGLFAQPQPPECPCPIARRPHPSLCHADKYTACCICLDPMESRHQLKCPKCTMRAHSKCLQKWFESSGGGKPPASIPGTDEAPARTCSVATCPNCRAPLDWDTLVIESRRTRMPLSQLLAKPGHMTAR